MKSNKVYQACLVLDRCWLMNFLSYPWEQEFPNDMVTCGLVTRLCVVHQDGIIWCLECTLQRIYSLWKMILQQQVSFEELMTC